MEFMEFVESVGSIEFIEMDGEIDGLPAALAGPNVAYIRVTGARDRMPRRAQIA